MFVPSCGWGVPRPKPSLEVGISSLLYNRQIKQASVVSIRRKKIKGPTITFVRNLSIKNTDKNVNEMVKKSKSGGKKKALRNAYSFQYFDKNPEESSIPRPRRTNQCAICRPTTFVFSTTLGGDPKPRSKTSENKRDVIRHLFFTSFMSWLI